jgi:hypothetical protein
VTDVVLGVIYAVAILVLVLAAMRDSWPFRRVQHTHSVTVTAHWPVEVAICTECDESVEVRRWL